MTDQPPVNVNVNQPPQPEVRISMAQVYTETLRANESNARIEGKVDRIIDKVDGLSGQVADHESRIRLLESNILTKKAVAGIFLGGAAVIGAVAAAVSALVGH